MKKIFAIALALVMVLSMTSAFAAYCDTEWDWSCATNVVNCGKATVEVIPYVRSTTACAGESEFVQSSCAAAVPGERVYFAVKLTIPSDINEDWWNNAKMSVSYSNLSEWETLYGALANLEGELAKAMTYDTVKDGGTYWLAKDGATSATVRWGDSWQKEKSGFTFGNDNVFYGWAKKSSAKVCVKLTSKVEMAGKWITIGDYDVYVNDNYTGLHIRNKSYIATISLDSDQKIMDVAVNSGNTYDRNTAKVFVGYDANGNFKYYMNGQTSTYTSDACNEGAFLKKVFDMFKLNFGTCMTKKAINKNFGWDNEQESCTSYKKDALAIVNPDCQVAIPKTGDVSVVAYAVMALVAAAGAMGLKK